MASTAFAATGGTDILVLAVAFTLLLPALPCALYRLVPLLRHPSSLQTAQNAALALATAVALALYALAALVALSGTGSWTVAVASGAFGCLSVTLTLCTHVPLLALLTHAVLVALAATRASFSVLFAVSLVALVAVTRVQNKAERSRTRSWEFAETSMETAESLPSRSRRIRLLVILVTNIVLDILSVAFAIREPYPRLTFSFSAARSGTLAPTLLGTTTSSEAAYLVIALFAIAQSILLTESVRERSSQVTFPRAAPRSTGSFESSFVEITLPPPSLPPRPHRSPSRGENSDYPTSAHTHDYASTPPASLFTTPVRALPTSTRQAAVSPTQLDVGGPSGARTSSTPTARSHRSLPPLTIGANFTPVSSGFKGRSHLTTPTLAARPSTASTTASLPRPSTASTTRSYRLFDDYTAAAAGSGHRASGSAPSSSSPTQYRRGSQFSLRRGRSGSYSSSVGRISGVPSLTRLSTIFNGGAVTTPTGKGSTTTTSPTTPTRRRSSSVGSLLRSAVPGGTSASAAADQWTSPPEWDVEPNEAHDDPFARPPPTPSEPTSTSTPAPSATPTRGTDAPGAAGSLAPLRLVRALEAIKEPENGSPPNPASLVEEGATHDDDVEDARPSSEGDHLERVLTPLSFPFSLEDQRARPTRSRSDSAASSLFHEHVDTSPPSLATPTVSSGFSLGHTTPIAVETRGRIPPDSPPRKRTETRPAAPSDFPSRLGDANSPAGTSDSLTPRNRSSSLRLLASSLASSGSARLGTLRRIRSSLRRRSPSPSPRGTNERPSESSELSFSCRGAEASLPDLHGDADRQNSSPGDAKSIKPVTPSRPVGLTPPPASVRLSVASRKAWWKHLSATSHTSSSLAGSDSLPQHVGTPSGSVSRSSWYLERGRMAKFAAVNARWSGYQLPPLDAVSPLSSSLFLPEGARRSDSRDRKSLLRRTKSSPAIIDPLPHGADATMISFAASSKFSSASFVTAHSTTGQARSLLSDPNLGIELDELNHLVDTFVPLPARDAVGSAPSSAALTPLSPLFGSPISDAVNGDDYDLVSPITPATPSAFVGVARELTGESNGRENASV
ncbi:hypothetical protein JCM8115_000006 [Rhodotorula mucilaginosa]